MPIDFSKLTQHLPSALTQKLATATLSKYWDDYKPQLIGGLAGAGIGAAGLGGAAAMSGEEDPEVKNQSIKRNLMLGAALGGIGGVGAGAGYKMYHEPEHAGMFSRLLTKATGSRAVQSFLGANAANTILRNHYNTGGPKVFGFGGNGGSFQGKSIDNLREMLDKKVTDVMSGIHGAGPATGAMPVSPAGPAASRLSAPEQGVRDMVERMSGGNGMFARMSQNPTMRRFGLNIVNPEAERQVLQSLKPMAGSAEGRAVLQRILSDQGIKGRGMPLLEKALMDGPAGEESLRWLNVFGRTLGRAGTGATAAAGIAGLAQLFGN